MSETAELLTGATVLVVGTADWQDQYADSLAARGVEGVQRVHSLGAALEAVRSERVDCLVTEAELEGGSGLDLLTRRGERDLGPPVILATTAGSEALAGEAVGAGAAEYVPIREPLEDSLEELRTRTEGAIRSGRRARRQRDRAQQFDAVFHDAQTATWVLDPDGSLARVNHVAGEMIEAPVDAVVGEPFWETAWWSTEAGVAREIRELVTAPRDGPAGNAVVRLRRSDGTDRFVELSIRPVENESGGLVSIVVEGIDVTEQVELEQELRRSEELHRVTLNNMTDTVLITDEDGEFTYVCPNVHFIFGYTAEEIREQGTIDDLLGADLFDRADLARAGVLKNIECTVTDKAGREHTLLVNVREVSIQDGTVLYSCRDVTKRKQREEALATLQETARSFLYAETHQEIAQEVVADVPAVLELPASAVYLFDVDANELRPVAHSTAMTDVHGPLPTVHADEETLLGHCFVADETLAFDDVHDSERLKNRATSLRSAIYIPLGDQGVFVAGSDRVGALDEVRRELADLLAATAEAALDRVSRESRLREQDRELQRQNERLAALNRINETIRAIDRAIVSADSRAEIDHTVCERLTDGDRFAFAWIGEVHPATDTVVPRAWAGAEQGYLDSLEIGVDAAGGDPAGRTAATGEPTVVDNVAADLRDHPWRSAALTRDFVAALSVPLSYGESSYGVLTVYAETRDAVDDTTLAVLRELGETIASASSAVERTHALLTTAVTRFEFEVDDETVLLSRLARAAGCTVSYRGGVQHTARGNDVFVTIDGASVEPVAEVAADLAAIDEVTVISSRDDGGVLRLRLQQPFLALELADHGAILREVTADPERTSLLVDVPENVDEQRITHLVRETFQGVELRGKRTLELGGGADRTSRFLAELTERQLEVLRTAYYGGYFEAPRRNSGEAVAESLDISPTAFYQHVRSVERKLFTTLFEDAVPEPAGPGVE